MTAKLIVADIRNGLPEIADNSIDVIITDPPYPKEYLYCWTELAKVAQRVLKPNGNLFSESGHVWLGEIIETLNKYLTYYWIISVYLPSAGGISMVHARHIKTKWKPILWYKKPPIKMGEYTGDVIYSDRVPSRDLHHWQQNIRIFNRIVKYKTKPKDKILDPFVGSGTTLLACKQLGRDFVGCDIDPKCIEITQKRLDSYQSIERWMK